MNQLLSLLCCPLTLGSLRSQGIYVRISYNGEGAGDGAVEAPALLVPIAKPHLVARRLVPNTKGVKLQLPCEQVH